MSIGETGSVGVLLTIGPVDTPKLGINVLLAVILTALLGLATWGASVEGEREVDMCTLVSSASVEGEREVEKEGDTLACAFLAAAAA